MKTIEDYYQLLGLDVSNLTSSSSMSLVFLLITALSTMLYLITFGGNYSVFERNNLFGAFKYLGERVAVIVILAFLPIVYIITPLFESTNNVNNKYQAIANNYQSVIDLEYMSKKLYNTEGTNVVQEADVNKYIIDYFLLKDYQESPYTEKIKDEFTEIFSDGKIYVYEYEYLVKLFKDYNFKFIKDNYDSKVLEMKELSSKEIEKRKSSN